MENIIFDELSALFDGVLSFFISLSVILCVFQGRGDRQIVLI